MKNLKKLFLLLAVIVTAVVCFAFSASAKTVAATGQCGDNVYWEYDESTCELIISGTGAMADYETYYGSPFYDSNIKSVVINEGVTTIGEHAFHDCDSLTKVTIPDSVTTIGDYAFLYCYSLTEVTIGDSVTTIGDHTFYSCVSLTKVTIPDSVTTIGDSAFGGCKSLTEVTIPDSVTTIGDYAFYHCDSLTEVTIPNSVTTIGNRAFYSCDSLTEVTIGDSVATIGDYAFYDCYSLTEVTIGNSVTTIGDYAFHGCESLTKVTIPDSVTTIGDYAFAWCYDLTEVTIGDSVTTIGDDAFYSCDSLTEVIIPDSVTTIGNFAFSSCYSIADITVDENNKYFSNDEYGVLFNKAKTTLVQYPVGNKRTAYTIPDSVTTIGDDAFEFCDSLTEVTIPDSVTTIGDDAFEFCDSLTEVSIPDSVTTIGDYAFAYCYDLTEVTIGNSVTIIGDCAFYYCESLTEVTIPDSVTIIGDCAFYECTNLTEVIIGNGVTTIGNRAFYNCDSLTEVYYCGTEEQWKMISIGSYNSDLTGADLHYNYCSHTDKISYTQQNPTCTSIGYTAGTYCPGCEEWLEGYEEIPATGHTDSDYDKYCDICEEYTEKLYKSGKCGDNVTYNWYEDGTVIISGKGAMTDYYYHDDYEINSPFYESSIKSVVINEGVTTIGDYAFVWCESLTEVTIGDGVTTIGDSAFCSCYCLTEVTIGDSVTTIGDSAFYNCDSLKEVTIPDSVTTIGASAFYNCYSLTDITVDENNQYFSNDEYGVLFNKDKTTLIQYQTGNKRTSYTIPDSVITIGDYAFRDCESLTEVTIPDSVTSIGDYAFVWCESLTEVTIGDGVTTIGNYAFYDCGSLKEVTIPDSVTVIGVGAFATDGMVRSSLVKVAIPDSVTTIGDEAFYECYNLTDVYYGGTQEQWKKIKIGSDNGYLTSANIHYICYHINKTTHAQQNPTCTSIGYTKGTYCPDCEEWLSGHEEISKIPHSYTKYTSNKNATLLADGTKTALCDYGCGNKKTVTDKGSKLVLGDVTGLKATPTTSSVTLKWNKAKNATGYGIYYKLSGDLSWRECVSYTTATSYTFKNLPDGTTYTFAVRSVGKTSSKTFNGAYISVKTATKTVKPATVVATQNTSAIKLSWSACKGATGYRIYYKSGSSWKIAVNSTKMTSHTFKNLKSGVKYIFAIRPYIKTESGNVWSAYTQFTTATKPANPTAKVTAPSKGKLTVTWNAVNGADSYQLWYKAGNGSYKLYKTYSSAKTLNFKNLKSCTKYTFAVRAVIKTDGGNIRSGYKAVSATVK